MKKFMLAAVALALLPLSSRAQSTPQADVSVGYSLLEVDEGYIFGLNGVSGSAAYNINNWLGAVADIGVYHGSPSGEGLTAETFLFGPRFSYRKTGRVVPFAQALFGPSHASGEYSGAAISTTPFAFAFGGGADIGLGSSCRIAFRPQAEYLGFRTEGATSNTARVSLSLVFHIGKK